MSTTHRPAPPTSSADQPTATFPTGQWLADQAAHRERLADLWEDATPTEPLPVVGPPYRPRTAFPAVDDEAAGAGRAGGRRERADRADRLGTGARRHLRAALAGLLIAAALLAGTQFYAAAGVSSARQAALAQRDAASPAPAVTPTTAVTPASPVNTPQGNSSVTQNAFTTPQKSQWIIRDTGAPYSRTDPTASPLDLPACTTSPSTPMPCLAWKSADSHHAVVLEEDASLTALVRQ